MKQKIVMEVHMHCDRCRTKALKIAASVDGVISVAIDGSEKDKLVVVGEGVDAAELTMSLRKKVNYAIIESVEEAKSPEEGNPTAEEEPVNPTISPCWDPRPPNCQLLFYDPSPPPPACSIL